LIASLLSYSVLLGLVNFDLGVDSCLCTINMGIESRLLFFGV
jgi:hypothetical protein